MLLTATATPRVRKDILLKMELLCDNSSMNSKLYCAFFIQSFNRKNLIYTVEYKTSNKAALEKIHSMIKTKFQNKSGIVYCISRNECETVSKFLHDHGIKSLAYHAGMSDQQRIAIQHRWTNNIDCKVVCATIGMLI
jgi:bloom syndrome protein